MPLLIAADGICCHFVHKTSKARLFGQRSKWHYSPRLGSIKLRQTKLFTVASTSIGGGDINYLQPAYNLKPAAALLQRLKWFGSLMERRLLATVSAMFAHCAVGILDFIMPLHLWQCSYAKVVILPDSQIWFARMRHQLRHGFGKRIIKKNSTGWRSLKNTTEATKPTLRQVRDYLNTHLDHIQYRSFKSWDYLLEAAWWKVRVNGLSSNASRSWNAVERGRL